MICLSNGECNGCKIFSGVHEGCDIGSATPVCDADTKVAGIQDSAVKAVAKCVACKKSGKMDKNLMLLNFFNLI